ncbi:hypothetical protein PY793_09405 [Acetobacter fabarum]|uniref:hypothetical protein n=1 Tax=Acetobacter TaxID=434 RepID=UPI00312B30C2
MSDGKNTIAQKSAPRKGDAAGKASPEQVRRFQEAQARKAAMEVPTLKAAKDIVPDETRVAQIVSHFAIETADTDELIGTGDAIVRDQFNILYPVLVNQIRGDDNLTALKMHLDRIVDALVRSAIGAANFYETRRQIARDAKDQFANEHRDQDRMGVDGGENQVVKLARIAAENGVKAYSVTCVAEGACRAYAELMGEEWKAYQNTRSKQPVDEKATAAMLDALGI